MLSRNNQPIFYAILSSLALSLTGCGHLRQTDQPHSAHKADPIQNQPTSLEVHQSFNGGWWIEKENNTSRFVPEKANWSLVNYGFEDDKNKRVVRPEQEKTDSIPQDLAVVLFFNSGKSAPTSQSLRLLTQDVIAQLKVANEVWIQGHTDSIGSQAANVNLSKARARHVKNLLIHRGVPDAIIQTIGHGESQPISDNHSTTARAKNRRVIISLKE